ncbi:hypothetical protein D0T66_00125 [Dysgonomonas sp. 25]|nr:hypothetical protein [Dysgonomonas sp. 25]
MLSGVSMATAQVTIGSNNVPNAGALLDLKQYAPTSENATATKGLMLPRLKLTDLGNLYPMFEDPGVPGTPKPEYQGALKAQEDLKHVGLLVYNLDQCQGLGEGVYLWTGNEWFFLQDKDASGIPAILVNGEGDKNNRDIVVHVPSGVDLRTFNTQQTLTIGWKTDDLTASITSATNTLNGGLSFITNPPTSWVGAIPNNSTNYTFSIDDMSALPDITGSNPWQSRETTIKAATSVDICGANADRTIILNQTNYALRLQDDSLDFNLVIKTPNGYNPLSMSVKSNATWKVTYTEVNPGVLTNIIYPAQKGKELMDGTVLSGTITPQRASNIEKLKYKVAGTMYFEDSIPAPNNRFKPITVSVVKCQGELDMSSVTTTAIPDESSANNWNNKVVRHQEKLKAPGDTIYHEFYSADFGPAGRWMVTNLVAHSYDTNQPDVPILGYLGDGAASRDTKVYAYPRYKKLSGNAWGDLPDEVVAGAGRPWYLEEGLLYNWFTATNRILAPDAIDEGQIDNGADNTPGANEVEGKFESSAGLRDGTVQGICPNGWHIPSDREWNRLEKEMYNNPEKYSIYNAKQISKFTPSTWQQSFETESGVRRGSSANTFGHAGVMHSLCPPDDVGLEWMKTHKGYSKPPYEGGFNIISMGYIETGDTPKSYAYSTMFWSSSKTTGWTAYTRQFDKTKANVGRIKDGYFRLLPVRCVKD